MEFSKYLSDGENKWLNEVYRYGGSAAYPIRKYAGKWFVEAMHGVGSCPIAFKTKREARLQAEAYERELVQRAAGRR